MTRDPKLNETSLKDDNLSRRRTKNFDLKLNSKLQVESSLLHDCLRPIIALSKGGSQSGGRGEVLI